MNEERYPIKEESNGSGYYEVSANAVVEAMTKRLEREFKCSNPKPRNRAMGFKGYDRPKEFRFGNKPITKPNK